jgi:hypothetical protein
MLADPAIRSMPGRLGPEERRPEYPVGLGRCCPPNTENEYIPYILMVYTKQIPSI